MSLHVCIGRNCAWREPVIPPSLMAMEYSALFYVLFTVFYYMFIHDVSVFEPFVSVFELFSSNLLLNKPFQSINKSINQWIGTLYTMVHNLKNVLLDMFMDMSALRKQGKQPSHVLLLPIGH